MSINKKQKEYIAKTLSSGIVMGGSLREAGEEIWKEAQKELLDNIKEVIDLKNPKDCVLDIQDIIKRYEK